MHAWYVENYKKTREKRIKQAASYRDKVKAKKEAEIEKALNRRAK